MAKIPISVLAVDDEESLLEVLKRLLAREGYYVHAAPDGAEAIAILQTLPFDLVLLDIKMPKLDGVEVLKFIRSHLLDTQVIMLSALNELDTAVECMRLGAYDYLRKPYDHPQLLAVIHRALERKQLLIENKALRTELQRLGISANIVTQDKAMLAALETAARVAATDSPVLIQGEIGTGKQVIADFLHKNSGRREKPFLTVECRRGSGMDFEGELFGHERSAFTEVGSTEQGLAEIANGGTLLLDEVQHLSMTLQLRLLEFLQTGEFRRIGGGKTLKSDVRIITSTSGDLQKIVADGMFRQDLFEQLSAVTLKLPPLRERTMDIPLLVDAVLEKLALKRGLKRIENKALDVLLKYDWPGNVGELKNVLEATALVSPEEIIRVEDLVLPVSREAESNVMMSAPRDGLRVGSAVSLNEVERGHIEGVLSSVRWDQRKAARILGLTPERLSAKMKTLKLKKSK